MLIFGTASARATGAASRTGFVAFATATLGVRWDDRDNGFDLAATLFVDPFGRPGLRLIVAASAVGTLEAEKTLLVDPLGRPGLRRLIVVVAILTEALLAMEFSCCRSNQPAEPGATAGVAVPFNPVTDPIKGNATLTDTQMADLMASK